MEFLLELASGRYALDDLIRWGGYSVFGGIGWVVSLTWAGYWLGQTIPDIVVGIVIVLSVVPIGVEWWRARRETVLADR